MPVGQEHSIFSSINTNNSIVAGALNIHPTDELLDSYHSNMSNPGMKLMFRQLRKQAKEEAKAHINNASRAAQRILRDSNDYAMKVGSTAKKAAGKRAAGSGPQSLPNAFKTVQIQHRDIAGERRQDKSSVPSQRQGADVSSHRSKGPSLPKFSKTGRAQRLQGMATGPGADSATISYYNGSQDSIHEQGPPEGGRLPTVGNQPEAAGSHRINPNLMSDRMSAPDETYLLRSHHQEPRKPGLSIEDFDFTMRNISRIRSLRVQKTVEMENARKQIDEIHESLGVSEIKLEDRRRLERLQNAMEPMVKERFMSSPLHSQITQNWNTLNGAGLALFEQVSCYRVELGQSLQKLMQCYSALYLQQLNVFNLTDSQRQAIFQERMSRLAEEEESISLRERRHEQMVIQVREMQEAKQKLVDDLKQREADLMKQNERLQKMIEEQWKGTQEPRLLSDDEFQKAWRDISFRWNKKKINDKDESFDPDTSLETILAMETTFQKHAETTEDKRINLKDIQRTVQTMMFQLQ